MWGSRALISASLLVAARHRSRTQRRFCWGGGDVQLVQVAHSVGVTLTTSLPLFVCLCVCERDAITPKTLPFQGSPWKRRLQRCARSLRCPFNF